MNRVMHEGEREPFHRTALIIDCLNLLVSDTRVAERVPARRNLCTRIFRGGEVAQQHRLEEYYSIIVHQPRVISLRAMLQFSLFFLSIHPPFFGCFILHPFSFEAHQSPSYVTF